MVQSFAKVFTGWSFGGNETTFSDGFNPPKKELDGRDAGLADSSFDRPAAAAAEAGAVAGQFGQTPPNLFSHSDQQSQWQAGTSDASIKLGWGGRVAVIVASLNGAQNVATAIAVNGRSGFHQGATVSPFLVSSNGDFGYDSSDATSRDALSVGFGEMINAPRSHLFEAAWNDAIKRGVTTQAVFQEALSRASPLVTPFPGTGLGSQLGTVVFSTLRVNGPDDSSNGRWIPTTATEQYATALGSGFGLNATELTRAFPMLSRFAVRPLPIY